MRVARRALILQASGGNRDPAAAPRPRRHALGLHPRRSLSRPRALGGLAGPSRPADPSSAAALVGFSCKAAAASPYPWLAARASAGLRPALARLSAAASSSASAMAPAPSRLASRLAL